MTESCEEEEEIVKKTYEAPELEAVSLENDVIVTSPSYPGPDDPW